MVFYSPLITLVTGYKNTSARQFFSFNFSLFFFLFLSFFFIHLFIHFLVIFSSLFLFCFLLNYAIYLNSNDYFNRKGDLNRKLQFLEKKLTAQAIIFSRKRQAFCIACKLSTFIWIIPNYISSEISELHLLQPNQMTLAISFYLADLEISREQ